MKVELLAPGGSFESVLAAYNAGADAVYTGGMMFGARAGADNLSLEQMIEALNYAHIHNKKLYLTVNTLLKDEEIENKLYSFIAPLYENGLDAVIVQDMGVLKFINSHFKGLNIHASTQMTIFGSETVRELSSLGVTRIVTPRELSAKEIKDIRDDTSDIGMEIESFVHGALCYCYSGQCFMSSYIGGRSGNRGRCAQPCRMEYDLICDSKTANQGNNKYILSPKDICTLRILPQIIESGVYSLKIEGRMKKTEYIAGVTLIYRKYIDLYLNNPESYHVDSKDIEKLSDLFNRNGFNESYYNCHNGRDMISLKKPEFRKENKEFNQYLNDNFSGRKLKKELDVSVSCVAGEPLRLYTKINNQIITEEGGIVTKALNRPIDAVSMGKQIRKTGNTDYIIKNINIKMDDNVFVPIGAINELRRHFLDKVTYAILKPYKRKFLGTVTADRQEKVLVQTDKNKKIFVSVDVWSHTQFLETVKKSFVSRIYIEAEGFSKEKLKLLIEQGKKSKKEIYLAMPYVFRKKDKEKFDKNLLAYVKLIDGVLIRNPEQYYHLRNLGIAVNYIFDYNVYTNNKIAKEYYSDNQNSKTTAPLELNFNELLKRGCDGDEVIVYGYMPVMISAGCGLKTCNLCNGENKQYRLKDRKNNQFLVRCVCGACYNIMYNSKPLSLFKYFDEIFRLNADSLRLSFTIENAEETKNILTRAEQVFFKGVAISEDDKSTRGHFKRGVL